MHGGAGNMGGEKKMVYKKITFKAAPFSYELSFDDRITLVGGDSGTGKTVMYEMLEDVRLTEQYNAIKLFNYKSENMKESLMKCRDCFIVIDSADIEKTLQYLAGFKRFSTEKVMKSLAGELTENEKWSIKGALMGECWYEDCCISEHLNSLRCGKPEVESGNEKMRMLMQSEEVRKILNMIEE